jgi:hypothetical protein
MEKLLGIKRPFRHQTAFCAALRTASHKKACSQDGKSLEGITEASFVLQVKAAGQGHHRKQQVARGHHRGELCSAGEDSKGKTIIKNSKWLEGIPRSLVSKTRPICSAVQDPQVFSSRLLLWPHATFPQESRQFVLQVKIALRVGSPRGGASPLEFLLSVDVTRDSVHELLSS